MYKTAHARSTYALSLRQHKQRPRDWATRDMEHDGCMHAQYSCACCDSDARLSKASRLAGGRVRCIHSLQEDSDAEREAAVVALVEPLAVLEPARSNREGRVRVGRGASEGRVRDEWVRRPDRCAWGDGWRAHCCRQDVASSELTLGVHSFRLLCAPISSISFSSLASISSSCAGGGTARGLAHAVLRLCWEGGHARFCGRAPARPCRGWCPA